MHGLHLAAVTASFFSLTAGQQWVGCDSGICLGLPDAPSNATRSVNFKPFTNDTEWTWRVNVTDYATEGGRGMDITYDFSWPGGGNLTSATPRSPYCAVAMLSWGTAGNITAKYTEANNPNSTDCTPVLGSACVQAVLASAVKNPASCWDGLWSRLPECADTFGIDRYRPYGDGSLLLQAYSLTDWTRSGRPFHLVSAGPDSTREFPGLYRDAVDMLQVVLLRPPLWLENDTFHPTLNCMRINTAAEESGGGEGEGQDREQGGSGGQAGSQGNKGGNNNAASNVGAGLWTLMGGLAVALL